MSAWLEKMNISKKFKVCSKNPVAALPLLLVSISLPVSYCQSPGLRKHLTIEAPTQIVVRRGIDVAQKLQIAVEPGFHVNSDKPKDEFLIPLKLTWSGSALEAGAVTYPKSEQVRVGSDNLDVFTGTFTIETRFKSSPAASPGPALMTAKLTYQACNNIMCFRPSSAEVRLPVIIE